MLLIKLKFSFNYYNLSIEPNNRNFIINIYKIKFKIIIFKLTKFNFNG
jgi:hypothetical protein